VTVYGGEGPLRPSVLVLGIGNRLKGDDAVGPYIASLLSESQGNQVVAPGDFTIVALDCGTVPENYTGIVRRVRPYHLVLVDAADMGLEAGAVRIVPVDMIGSLGLSTHSMPLSMFISYVADIAGRTTLIGIQPEGMQLGADLSDDVAIAARCLAARLAEGRLSGIATLGDDPTRR